MNGIKCPICNERVVGERTADLNESLRAHMVETHQMREMSSSSSGRTGGMASFARPETRAEREVSTFSGPTPWETGPEASRRNEEVSQFKEYRGPEGRTEREVTRFREDRPMTAEQRRREEEVNRWASTPSKESRMEPQVSAFTARDPYRESEEERNRQGMVGGYPRTEVQGERGSMSEARHGGGLGHRMTHYRREMTMMLDCPICGSAVYGSDDEDLSDELRFHFRDVHNIRRE